LTNLSWGRWVVRWLQTEEVPYLKLRILCIPNFLGNFRLQWQNINSCFYLLIAFFLEQRSGVGRGIAKSRPLSWTLDTFAWVKVCRRCLKPFCGRYSKELEYLTVSFNVFYERDIWLSGWYGVSFLDKLNFFSFNGDLLMSFLLFEQMSLLMYDVHNNLAPDNIKNMFTKLSSVHSYRTRSVTNENYHMLNNASYSWKWSEPSLFPVLWFGTVFHFLSKHLKKKSIQKGTKGKTLWNTGKRGRLY